MSSAWQTIIDWVWPSAAPFLPDDLRKEGAKEATTLAAIDGLSAIDKVKQLEGILEKVESLFDDEDARRASIDTRLSTIVSLTSTASALVLAIVAFLTSRDRGPFLFYGILLANALGVYVIFQLLCAVGAAIKGLERRGYQSRSLSIYVSRAGDEKQQLIREIKSAAECFLQNQRETNVKVTQMAIAHRAVSNAVWGLVIAALLLFGMTIWVHVGGVSKPATP